METPIYSSLQQYINKDIYPFHMPGHKQGRGLNMQNIFKLDITEINEFDNLHNAEGIILESQKLTAKLFGAEETFFLINGSTSGIIASILASCNPNDKLLVARNCHRSVYSGMIFTGVTPIYISPEIIKPYGINGGIKPEDIHKNMKDVKAVIITSPTYEGFCSDIKIIADIVHSYNAILIVDEAHGAHFKFNNSFPQTALEQGADIVIQSLHKTLPSLTQTALLHIQGNRVDRDKLKQMLSMVQSSSPSYILMSSIDLCKSQISSENFDNFVDRLNKFRKELEPTKSLKLLDKELENTYGIKQIDISKLVIYCCTNSLTGFELDKLLYEKYKLQIEMSQFNYIVALTSIADTDGFEQLLYAINSLDENLDYSKPQFEFKTNIEPIVSITPREAIFKSKISVPLHKSIEKISGEFVIPYPPGIPILAPGELITEEIVNLIIYYQKNNISILGTKSNINVC